MSEPTYFDVYLKRLNRYGNDYQRRVQTKREAEFETYLLRSVYRVDFEYDGEMQPATFEKYKQDETQTLHYLLTRTSISMPSGTILMVPDKDDVLMPWMVFYLESMRASGYNRYIMLKMTHFLTWKDENNEEHSSWAYLFGQQNGLLRDDLQAARSDVRYTENLKTSFFIMPRNEFLKKDTYLEVGEDPFKEAFQVTGYDIQSTPGVEYVTIDPVYLHDTSPTPERAPEDSDEDFFWLGGGM